VTLGGAADPDCPQVTAVTDDGLPGEHLDRPVALR
jgi:hypothetical protein